MLIACNAYVCCGVSKKLKLSLQQAVENYAVVTYYLSAVSYCSTTDTG
jgi:hypothetical protein